MIGGRRKSRKNKIPEALKKTNLEGLPPEKKIGKASLRKKKSERPFRGKKFGEALARKKQIHFRNFLRPPRSFMVDP